MRRTLKHWTNKVMTVIKYIIPKILEKTSSPSAILVSPILPVKPKKPQIDIKEINKLQIMNVTIAKTNTPVPTFSSDFRLLIALRLVKNQTG